MTLYAFVSCRIIEAPDHFKTQEISKEAVHIEPHSLAFVHDHFKTQEICNEAVRREPCALDYVPDHLKTQDTCNDTVDMGMFLTTLKLRRCATGQCSKNHKH